MELTRKIPCNLITQANEIHRSHAVGHKKINMEIC